MSANFRAISAVLAVGATVLLAPDPAYAYGGPGSIITGIGALLAVVAALAAAIFGFFWYPAKRLVNKLRGTGERGDPGAVEAREELARE